MCQGEHENEKKALKLWLPKKVRRTGWCGLGIPGPESALFYLSLPYLLLIQFICLDFTGVLISHRW